MKKTLRNYFPPLAQVLAPEERGGLTWAYITTVQIKQMLTGTSHPTINPKHKTCAKVGLFYKNLDVSNSQLPFVIKITGHSTIDLLSTDKDLLKETVNENISSNFILKNYRGTQL